MIKDKFKSFPLIHPRNLKFIQLKLIVKCLVCERAKTHNDFIREERGKAKAALFCSNLGNLKRCMLPVHCLRGTKQARGVHEA